MVIVKKLIDIFIKIMIKYLIIKKLKKNIKF